MFQEMGPGSSAVDPSQIEQQLVTGTERRFSICHNTDHEMAPSEIRERERESYTNGPIKLRHR